MEPGALASMLRRGTLEYCGLALLQSGERYGVELVQQLGEVDGLTTSEGTIYPLLSRLRREGLVDTTWRESPTGPPRRYYNLSPSGAEALKHFATEWVRYRAAVDGLLGTGGKGT